MELFCAGGVAGKKEGKTSRLQLSIWGKRSSSQATLFCSLALQMLHLSLSNT